jgi:hypothetical protein
MTQPNSIDHFERMTRLIVIGAAVWMLGVGLWEIAAPFGAGHAAVLPARGIIADNMLEYGIGFPVRNYAAAKPTVAAAYAHHPFGTYYLFAVSRWVFGRHEWALRLVPVLVSIAMPALLFAVGRRLFGSLGGALSALGWAVLPITLAFAQFPSFEMFSLAAILLLTLAALRFAEHPSRGRMATLLTAVALALQTDWVAYLFVVLLAATALVGIAFGPNRARERQPESLPEHLATKRFLQALVLVVAIVLATLLLYVTFFRQAGLIEDWLGSAETRAHGNDLAFREVLQHRRYWIEVMFTKPGIALGLFGALLLLGRWILFQRFRDLYPLLILVTAIVHYVYFKNGADVHVYWPLPFAAQFCFGLGVLALGIQRLGGWLAERQLLILSERRVSLLALGICGTWALALLPDGLRALDYARDSGCRLNDDGQLNLQDLDKNLALQFFKQSIAPRQPVTLQTSMFTNWSQDWALQRPTVNHHALGLPTFASSRYSLFDVRFALPTAATWAIQSHTSVVGPFWLVDLDAAPGEFRAYGFEVRSPSWLERIFVQAHDPIRRIVPDPYRTWEYRQHLAIEPNPVPPGLERRDLQRILHNVLVAEGNRERAAQIRVQIEGTLDKRSARSYQGGLQLLGHRLLTGVVPRLELYFLAARSVGPNAFFDVGSRILEAPGGSFVVKDDKEKHYGVGFEIHPSLWQTGMIYVSSVEVRRRPGHESFFAVWTGPQRPLLVDGDEEIPLFERR